MAGLITSVDGLSSSGLVTFLTGGGIATKTGRIEQFRNNLKFDYGDIINGVTSDGSLFDIRINNYDNYEYGSNLTRSKSVPEGVIDSGDALTIDITAIRRRFEQSDVARTAFGLLLAAKGDIDEETLNNNSAYSGLHVLDRKDAFDRLNIDSEKSFRVNGAEFELVGEEIRIRSLPGQGRSNRGARDLDIEKARKKLEKQAEALGFGLNKEVVDMKDATINTMLAAREQLEANYNYVAFSFEEEAFIASNNFKDVFDALAEVPDALLMGANLAYQLEMSVGDELTQSEKNEIFPASLTYFSSLIAGALTGLPTQVQSEFEYHAGTNLYGLYGRNADRAIEAINVFGPKTDDILNNFFYQLSAIEVGADLETLREGLGGKPSNGTYTLRRYDSAF